MKKLLLLLTLSIFMLNCDSDPEPIKTISYSTDKEKHSLVEDYGEDAKIYIEGRFIYIKDKNNLFRKTVETTNTFTIPITIGSFLICLGVSFLIGIVVGYPSYN